MATYFDIYVRAFNQSGPGFTAASNNIRKLQLDIGGLKSTIAGIGVGALASAFVKAGDDIQNFRAKINLVSKDAAEGAATFDKLFKISQDTSVSIGANANLFSRLASNISTTVASNDDLLAITKEINQSIAISGTTAQESEGALIQFTQAMASGFSTAGQEINSIREEMPFLLRLIVDGINQINPSLKVTVGNFKQLASQGKITGELVAKGPSGRNKESR